VNFLIDLSDKDINDMDMESILKLKNEVILLLDYCINGIARKTMQSVDKIK
jgi:hypothetical protein